MNGRVSHSEKARLHWNEGVPDWVAALAAAADQSSQGKVARELGISTTQISQIIGNTYPGNTANAEDRVRGRFMKATITCPALGEIGPHICRDWQAKAQNVSAHNSQRVRMFRACRRCPIAKEQS